MKINKENAKKGMRIKDDYGQTMIMIDDCHYIYEEPDEYQKNNEYDMGDLAGHDLELIDNIIEKAINILVEAGTKREYAEEEFKCLRNPLENAEKVINNKDFAMGYARDLNFVNEM